MSPVPCVHMEGQRTTIIDPANSENKKVFGFNFCYWSCDSSQKRHSQEDLFQDLGPLFVDNAFEGWNSSLFAVIIFICEIVL
jgi:hypothetical protein